MNLLHVYIHIRAPGENTRGCKLVSQHNISAKSKNGYKHRRSGPKIDTERVKIFASCDRERERKDKRDNLGEQFQITMHTTTTTTTAAAATTTTTTTKKKKSIVHSNTNNLIKG